MCEKSVINHPNTVTEEMLEGLSYAYPGLYIVPEKGLVMINKDRENRVALVCGSGAGYEPFATGFVGEGMLTAYISGKVGTAPRSDVILSTIIALSEFNKGGVLILILNYPREVLNFGIAIERARLQGLKVESIVLVDECSRWKAMRKEHYTNLAYKKGLCGCVFAFKILGALSSAGATMGYLVNEARALNFRTTTLGFCLEPFCHPGSNRPAFTLPERSAVIGLGLNGENGIRTLEYNSVAEVIKKVMAMIYEESNLKKDSVVFLLINKLSSLTTIESYIIAKEVNKYLAKKKVKVLRQVIGCFFTSFNSKGAHISVLNVTGKVTDWLDYFEKGAEAYGWPNNQLSSVNPQLESMPVTDEAGPDPVDRGGMQLDSLESLIFRKCLRAAFESLADAEAVLNQLNAYTGNGDCGTKLKDFSFAVLEQLKMLPTNDVSLTFQVLERLAEETMTGHIGAFYSMMLCGAGSSAGGWDECLLGAARYIGLHFPLVCGCKTLWDVVKPAFFDFIDNYNILGQDLWRTALQLAVDTAENACYETSKMLPKIGVYHPGKKMNMDAGAYSVVVWMRAVNNMLKMLSPRETLLPDSDDWRYKLEAQLFSRRSFQEVLPSSHIYDLGHITLYSSDDYDEEEGNEKSLEEI